MINDEIEKSWYLSKTLWVNILAVALFAVQGHFGYTVPPELYIIILGGINAALRIITKKVVVW